MLSTKDQNRLYWITTYRNLQLRLMLLLRRRQARAVTRCRGPSVRQKVRSARVHGRVLETRVMAALYRALPADVRPALCLRGSRTASTLVH